MGLRSLMKCKLHRAPRHLISLLLLLRINPSTGTGSVRRHKSTDEPMAPAIEEMGRTDNVRTTMETLPATEALARTWTATMQMQRTVEELTRTPAATVELAEVMWAAAAEAST
ncbi:hypothetical protein ACQJBY_059644 [Aegilops geniculata]